jgi:hypothetical protein
MKPPRSWDEALAHPAIQDIEFDKYQSKDDPDAPWLITLNEGWSINEDMTITYVWNFRDLQSLWPYIVNLPSETCY